MDRLKDNAALLIRCAMVAFFSCGGLSMPLDTDPAFKIAIVFFFVAPALMLPIQFLLYSRTKWEHTRNWSRPTWFTNPFSGTPQFMHAGAWAFIGMGLVATVRAVHADHILTSGLFPLCVGMGVYVGIRLFYALRPSVAG